MRYVCEIFPHFGNKCPLFVVLGCMDMDILGKNVTITLVDSYEDEMQMGAWLPDECKITIKRGLGEDETARTLLHEVAHAVYQMTGAPGRRLTEEDFATLCELFLIIFKNRE
jgi:hypothetical protein